jgi:hypothetical protein
MSQYYPPHDDQRYDSRDPNDWDGIERRAITRRYMDNDAPPAVATVGAFAQLFANGTTVGILVTIIGAIISFVFSLYNKVNSLEYREQTVMEKIADNKHALQEFKDQIKNTDSRISSLEDTVMQLMQKRSTTK